ncbi:hypothetical protein [Natrinema gelatinilyticum]|uniref:hypothetical protein n=1 Tax=Natrinema gelatinilyticum TaxID=2961571 RepID=UPI0020C1DC35|nr:hypothetical protein [Natrinema gelatinilyticum]
MNANTSRTELLMWVVFLGLWSTLVWSFNTGYVVKQLSPTGASAPTTLLGVPANVLYVVVMTGLLVTIVGYFLYRIDLTGVEEPKTDRVFKEG